MGILFRRCHITTVVNTDRPNPALNSDPACIVLRSFLSPCFLGSACRLGAGGDRLASFVRPLLTMRLIQSLFLAFASSLTWAQSTGSDCLSYEPTKVELTGEIILRPYFGPPNYGEDPKHDEKCIGIILRLAKPICVNGLDDLRVAESGVREIQLALHDNSSAQYQALKKAGLKGKFFVRGSLYHQFNGHHITLVLMSVDSIARAQAP